MENILARIREASPEELEQIMTAVEGRYAAAFPEWEVIYIAIHKAPEARRSDIQAILSLLRRGTE